MFHVFSCSCSINIALYLYQLLICIYISHICIYYQIMLLKYQFYVCIIVRYISLNIATSVVMKCVLRKQIYPLENNNECMQWFDASASPKFNSKLWQHTIIVRSIHQSIVYLILIILLILCVLLIQMDHRRRASSSMKRLWVKVWC